MRTAIPKSFLAYYPALYPQDELKESVVLLDIKHGGSTVIQAGHPPKYEPLERRESYDGPSLQTLSSLGPTKTIRLGGIALARSGDKGSNLNCGIFVRDPRHWPWFQAFMSRERMVKLLGQDWQDDYFLERVEFPNILAVHFVIYGILGRGVSGSSRLDSLGKAFADYIRDKYVDVPVAFLNQASGDGVKARI
jgi:hypothetical protein